MAQEPVPPIRLRDDPLEDSIWKRWLEKLRGSITSNNDSSGVLSSRSFGNHASVLQPQPSNSSESVMAQKVFNHQSMTVKPLNDSENILAQKIFGKH